MPPPSTNLRWESRNCTKLSSSFTGGCARCWWKTLPATSDSLKKKGHKRTKPISTPILCVRCSYLVSELHALHCHCDRVSAAEAQCRDPLLAVATDQFVKERDQYASAAGSNGMAKRHSAAVHVDFGRINSKLLDYCHGLNRESFIDFVEIDFFRLPSGLGPDFAYAIHRRHHHPLWCDAAGCLRDNPDHWLSTELFRP